MTVASYLTAPCLTGSSFRLSFCFDLTCLELVMTDSEGKTVTRQSFIDYFGVYFLLKSSLLPIVSRRSIFACRAVYRHIVCMAAEL